MFMRSFVFAAALCLTTAAGAAEWPAEAEAAMRAAGARLSAATTTAERVGALREIEAIAAAHPQAEGARITARLMAEKATEEAGPAAMLSALGELAAAGRVTDAETLGAIAAPLVAAIGEMQWNGTLMPEMAIQLDAALSNLNDAAKKANLPGLSEAIERATGDTGLAKAAESAISRIAAVATLARQAKDLGEASEARRRKFIDKMISMLPANSAPALQGPAGAAFRDVLVWNGSMYQESANALDLVAEAIETGRFDSARYEQIRSRIESLARAGPWGAETAKDFLKKLCGAIPVAGAWCSEAFDLAEKLISGVDCDAIDCDCGGISQGLLSGPLVVQCEIHQADMIGQCKAAGEVRGACLPDAKGPGATH